MINDLKWFIQILKLRVVIYKLENGLGEFIPEKEQDLLTFKSAIEELFDAFAEWEWEFSRFECWIINTFYETWHQLKKFERKQVLMR